METYDALVSTLALSMGAAWASGINLYAALFMIGYMGATGNIDLPPDLEVLSNPLVMAASGFMYAVEFFADKVPGVDTGWDGLHTFIRIPAGAMLAAGAVGDVSAATELAAAIVGGGVAAGSHVTKAGTRVMINTSPEPVTNWTASVTEDIAVIGGLWAALNHPVAFMIALIVFIILIAWLLPKLWRAVKTVFRKIGEFFGGKKEPDPEPVSAPRVTSSQDTDDERTPPRENPKVTFNDTDSKGSQAP